MQAQPPTSNPSPAQQPQPGPTPGDLPWLLCELFGDLAALAAATCGERLLAWAWAGEAWIQELTKDWGKKRCEKGMNCLGDFFGFFRRAPWQITPELCQAWVDHMAGLGYTRQYVQLKVTLIRRFYDYCGQHGVDPLGEPQANPTRGLRYPQPPRGRNLVTLSLEEARALLGAVDRDTSLIGKRDYAMLLLALRMGLEATPLRLLQWSQLHIKGEGAWLARRQTSGESSSETADADEGRGKALARLCCGSPPDVWEAMRGYLSASGRLETMQPEDYVFPPVVNLYQANLAGDAGEWDSSRPISKTGVNCMLQEYVECAGLQAGKISWRNMHHTAFKLRMEAGEDELSLHALMGKERLSTTHEYLKDLRGGPKAPLWRDDEITPRVRKRNSRSPGRYPTHGFYVRRLPSMELEELKADPAKGLESEIAVMRVILSRTLELFMQPMTAEEKIHLVEVYARAAGQLARLLKAHQDLEGRQDADAAALYEAMREAYKQLTGEEPPDE